MEIQQLRMFVAAAEEGSLRRAAKRMYIAQPQLSQIIRRLERELGASLFVRSHQGVKVTEIGAYLLGEATSILRQIDRVAAAVREASTAQDHAVTVGLVSGQMAAGQLTGAILNAFRSARPHTHIMVRELNFATQFSALDNGEVDVALIRLPAAHDRLVIRPLFDERRVLCLSRRHALSDAPSIAAETVLEQTMVGLAGPSEEWSDFWLLNDLRGGPGRTSGGQIATITDLKYTLILDNSLVMPVAECAWSMGLEDPGLRAVPLTGVAPSTIAVAYRRGEIRSDVAAFAECAEGVCRSLGDRLADVPSLISKST